jgi:hypothetical protein
MPETALDRCLSCLDLSVIAYKASVGVMAEGNCTIIGGVIGEIVFSRYVHLLSIVWSWH